MSNALKPLEPLDSRSEQDEPYDADALALLRRSPHPYHRRQTDIAPSNLSSESSNSDSPPRTTLKTPQSGSDREHTISDEEEKGRRKIFRTPSDSGTEADDEGYSFVRALPAPPARPRKGLRDSRGSGIDGVSTPLLTPSQVDEEGKRFPRQFKAGLEGPSPSDDEAKAARQKYLKRRRAELVRRSTEVGLLALLGLLVIRGCSCWERIIVWHRVEILSHVAIISSLVLLYSLRLLIYSRSISNGPALRLRQRIRIPAAFDPAPILYPATIPVLISLSLLPKSGPILLPNIILSLAALPTQLIPLSGRGPGFCSSHWMISALPLIASQNTEWPSKLTAPKPYMLKSPPPEGLDPEILVSLFALHQALLPPLHYLTTTSLLPTELHLLSIALINLLLFAKSPQMIILAAVIWIGGLGLFILCGHVLKWGVALARIPRWRFRRAGRVIKARQSFIEILNQSLTPRYPQKAKQNVSDSDADDDVIDIGNGKIAQRNLKLNTLASSTQKSNPLNHFEPFETRSAVERTASANFPIEVNIKEATSPTRKRRNTLANLPEPNSPPQPLSFARHRRAKSSAMQSYLSLTPTQAAVRKWAYAGYVYVVIAMLILGPIRFVVGEYALNGNEPFGWAIGYLFGHIQPLRFEVVNWNLEDWIVLPPLYGTDDTSRSHRPGRIEYLRRFVAGEANTRLVLCGYCVSVIAVGMVVVLRLSSVVEVDTRRKVFHGMMVAMLLPTIYVDPAFVALALVLVLSIFLLLDLLRASQLPPLSKPLAYFLTPYVDGRDLRGPVVVSHIFLLIGCAIPLWLSLAGIGRTGDRPWEGWEVPTRDVSMVAGVVCVGMGDAAASLIGRRYGRRKWPWAGGKSLEGSLAFAVAVTIGLVFGKAWLRFGQWDDEGAADGWLLTVAKAAVSACGASLNEAVLTGGNDNVIVPVILWLLVRGVRL
ncbi:uncharacterized protein BDZ99DRAFT_498182 [Mytilinidion resinicola]|uniref:dolichol kinase n=1 Tax=Mytilinidion resinicola TaxID=574789 RepID=A0A6A6YMZ6_9PEZI|nr:uncharacterized protein BDZ99DRAFT_498182 [Mytilinidion resinicola]KAF2809953.1 hypothetical protein BDZ99DRAFT_498182 [Mytilinidion resinicola]